MGEHWYAEETEPSIPSPPHRLRIDPELSASTGPWLWASQMRERLGEGGDLDANYLEEGWATGLPIGTDSFPGRKGGSAVVGDSIPFAALSNPGSFALSHGNASPHAPTANHRPEHATDIYTALWLRGSIPDGGRSRTATPASADGRQEARIVSTPGVMTHERACEVLCVDEDSDEERIKAAYRGMVRVCHPDRLEQSGELERALATRQMAAINEAYQLLRHHRSVAGS